MPNVAQLGTHYRNAQSKVHQFDSDADCYYEILSTCVYLEEFEAAKSLNDTEIPNINIKTESNSVVCFKGYGHKIKKAYADNLIHDVFVWPGGAGRAFKGKLIYYNATTGLMRVQLQLAPNLFTAHFDEKSYKITFGINRTSFQTQHLAISLSKDKRLFDLLVNNKRYFSCESRSPSTTYIDKIDLNPEQNLAIRSLINSEVSIPFLIFGPPGKNYLYISRLFDV